MCFSRTEKSKKSTKKFFKKAPGEHRFRKSEKKS